tara:strand:+ start:1732 stop:2988 length:1257 start_codon:yes stop_codon:yes gene_type:complete
MNINMDLNILSTFDSDDYQNKQYTYNNNIYNIIKYNKDKLKDYEKNDIEKFKVLSKYRSVIVRDNKVVVYSPGKSIDYENFKTSNNTSDVILEDFIDGTMINVFYDNINNTWEIATKSTVGGNIIFFNDIKNYSYFNTSDYKEKFEKTTFRSMFFECCEFINLNLESLNKSYCYSFVMQHPFNRIVTPVITPCLFLINIYCIDNKNYPNISINHIDINQYINTIPYPFLNTAIKIPNKYELDSYENLELHYKNIKTHYTCVGTMIYNKSGDRTKIRNPNYEEVRKLRGNHPKLQYNYLMLKKENKVVEFLHYYPECRIIFNKFKILIYNYTNELFLNYISCFIRKEKPLKEYEFQYKVHLYNIHKKYITELRESNKIVDKKVIIDYVNSLHPAQQMFVINFKNNKMCTANVESMEVTT